jgi:hypothetical protein
MPLSAHPAYLQVLTLDASHLLDKIALVQSSLALTQPQVAQLVLANPRLLLASMETLTRALEQLKSASVLEGRAQERWEGASRIGKDVGTKEAQRLRGQVEGEGSKTSPSILAAQTLLLDHPKVRGRRCIKAHIFGSGRRCIKAPRFSRHPPHSPRTCLLCVAGMADSRNMYVSCAWW